MMKAGRKRVKKKTGWWVRFSIFFLFLFRWEMILLSEAFWRHECVKKYLPKKSLPNLWKTLIVKIRIPIPILDIYLIKLQMWLLILIIQNTIQCFRAETIILAYQSNQNLIVSFPVMTNDSLFMTLPDWDDEGWPDSLDEERWDEFFIRRLFGDINVWKYI